MWLDCDLSFHTSSQICLKKDNQCVNNVCTLCLFCVNTTNNGIMLSCKLVSKYTTQRRWLYCGNIKIDFDHGNMLFIGVFIVLT